MLNRLKMELERRKNEAHSLKYGEDTLGDLLLFKLYPTVALCETDLSRFQSFWGQQKYTTLLQSVSAVNNFPWMTVSLEHPLLPLTSHWSLWEKKQFLMY